MRLIVNVISFAFGFILISSAPFDEKLKSGSQDMRQSSEESAVQQSRSMIPLVASRHFIKARTHGFCFRRLSFLLG